MHRAMRAAVVAAFCSVPLFFAGHALADVTIIGNGFAAGCSDSARAVANKGAPHSDALKTCDLALTDEALSPHEAAATHVNRGVLYLASAKYDNAWRDFDEASRIEPALGEAYVNRGAALIGQGRNAEGIADINHGLELNASEPEKAYFNRALAEERLDEVKAAYFDYMKALELKPDWDMPRTELERFHVETR